MMKKQSVYQLTSKREYIFGLPQRNAGTRIYSHSCISLEFTNNNQSKSWKYQVKISIIIFENKPVFTSGQAVHIMYISY